MTYPKCLLVTTILLLGSTTGFAQDASKFIWDKVAFEVLFIKDSTLISQVTRELLIPLKVKPQQIALVDLNFNGPGINDIVVVYPSHQVFTLDFLPDKVAKTIRKWPRPDYRLMLSPNDTTSIERLKKMDSKNSQLAPILTELHTSVKKIWDEQPLRVFYTQTSENLKLEILHLHTAPTPFWNKADSTTNDSTQKNN